MRQISEGIYGLLVSQGLANAKPVGAGRVRGIGAGLPGAQTDPLTAQAKGEDASRSGMEKAEGAKPPASRQADGERNQPGGRGGFALRVHMNPNVPTSTRQAARRSTASLVVVK